MTRGNQRELAPQKNMKKQSNSVKGKCPDDRLSAAAHKQRDSEIMPQKQKKANEKKEEPRLLQSHGPLKTSVILQRNNELVRGSHSMKPVSTGPGLLQRVSTPLHLPTNKNKASNMIHKQLMESSVLPYTYFLERKVLEKEIILAHVIFSAVPMAALGSHANPYLTPSEWISDITSYDTWMTEEHPFQDHRVTVRKEEGWQEGSEEAVDDTNYGQNTNIQKSDAYPPSTTGFRV
ncbi:hypothetical protein MJT46_013852 [Ovis ammon polii x Ovis aries]|nr:hypothetical protein MJT46_013852 [Ovis ammon polii x Ovis aries]